MSNFKSFSSKSNAKRGVIAAYKQVGVDVTESFETLLVQVDGKWGFDLDAVRPAAATDAFLAAVQTSEAKPADNTPAAETPVDAPKPRSAGSVFDLVPSRGAAKPQPKQAEIDMEAVQPEANDAPADEEQPAVVGGAFGSMMSALTTQRAAPATSASTSGRGGYKVEKDRPEQNGVIRPSKDGKCRQVWDKCDELRTANGGEAPSAKQMREVSEGMGWNTNNTMIEFYQWRKFNGIVGRASKKAE